MASLKCSGCSFGIRYHDEPCGIEYKALSRELWNAFRSTDKPIARYLLDGNDDFLCVWKCPECGCIHTFEAYRPVFKQAYLPCDEAVIPAAARKYLVFNDFLFEEIAERGLTAERFVHSGKYSSDSFFYAMISDERIATYEDEACRRPLKYFKAIETIAGQ